MYKKQLVTAACLGALSVALGAFGAHSLKDMVSQESLKIFETAVRYQFYHVFALALTGLLYKAYANKKLKYAGNLFILGIIFFSGSLYLLTFLGTDNFKWIGAITPLGGIFLIAGWLLLAAGIKEGGAEQ
jgi:uncharacterized membrane protein YgdD (TMEM256/DUF423 family)